MTLGQRIRKFRLLRGLTQKELGQKALRVKTGADVRINQYEKDIIAPKADARASLAKVLDCDIEALSDVGFKSDEDIMYILFALEESRGLHVTKENGKIHLIFEEPNDQNENANLTTYLNFWENEASRIRITAEEKTEYDCWKAKFSSSVNGYLAEKEAAINNLYADDVKAIFEKKELAEETPELTKLLKQIVDAEIRLSIKLDLNSIVKYTFEVDQLLNPASPYNKNLFARFLAEINHFKQLGADCITEMYLLNDMLTITYYVPVPGLNTIGSHILGYIKAVNEKKSDFDVRRQVELFDSVRKNIKDEIEEYVAIRDGK